MKKNITLCSSASHYKEVIEYRDKLKALGFKVFVPVTATKMEKAGDYDVSKHKVWFNNAKQYYQKTAKMKGHLRQIDKGDAILVINMTKKGQKGYIGGNVLLEMFYAWLHKKPIYLLNEPSQKSPLLEEILGMSPVVIDGELTELL